jgi:hypothetical protein
VFLQILPEIQAATTKIKTKPHTKIRRSMVWAKGKTELVITAIIRRDMLWKIWK